jgi:hypothetical protein
MFPIAVATQTFGLAEGPPLSSRPEADPWNSSAWAIDELQLAITGPRTFRHNAWFDANQDRTRSLKKKDESGENQRRPVPRENDIVSTNTLGGGCGGSPWNRGVPHTGKEHSMNRLHPFACTDRPARPQQPVGPTAGLSHPRKAGWRSKSSSSQDDHFVGQHTGQQRGHPGEAGLRYPRRAGIVNT